MALAPIDLQTLFLHMDQPGKEQAITRESVLHTQNIQAGKLIQKAELAQTEVTKTAEVDDDNMKIHDKETQDQTQNSEEKKESKEEEAELEKKPVSTQFKDDRLGSRVDLTG